jgi:dihydroxyacetone kinase DhaKLM complex PTS-EIIA-like component DhaM
MKNSTLYRTTIISIFYAVSILTEAGAQNCATYFPLSKGASYEFEMFNAKQKKTGRMVYIIQDVQTGSAKTEAQIVHEFYDKRIRSPQKKIILCIVTITAS